MDNRKLLVGLLWDVGVPAVVFYAGRALGLDAPLALAAAGLTALLRVAYVAAFRRRLDGLAAFVAGTVVLLLAVSLLTGDPRILLAKESILSGAVGLLLVGSCAIGRPILYALIRRLNAGKPEALARLDERWRTQPSFRRRFTVLSSVIGCVLLLESAVRLVLVHLLPLDVMAGLSPVLHVGTLGLLAGWVMWYRRRPLTAAATGQEHAHAR